MATAVAPSVFDQLLQQVIGSQKSSNTNETLGVTNLIKQLMSGTTNQSTTGATTTAQDQTTKTTADIGRLVDVYNKQSAGITPEQLKSIFTEGSKAVPGLTAATANAVGARSSGNSALATSLTDLNSNLTSKAADMNTQLLQQSGTTASQIAELTKQLQTSGGTTQNVNQNVAGTSTQNTDTTQNQGTIRNLDTTDRTTINPVSTGLGAGAGLLASLLGGGSSGSGLLSGLGGNLGQLGSYLGNLLGLGGSSAGSVAQSSDTLQNLFGNAGYGDWSSTNTSIPDYDYGDMLSGWADGGLVPTPQLSMTSTSGSGKKKDDEDQAQMMLMSMLGSKVSQVAQTDQQTQQIAQQQNDNNPWYDSSRVAAAQAAQGKGDDGRTVLQGGYLGSILKPLSGVTRNADSYTDLGSFSYTDSGGEGGGQQATWNPNMVKDATSFNYAGNKYDALDAENMAALGLAPDSGEYFAGSRFETPGGNGDKDNGFGIYKYNDDGSATPIGGMSQYDPHAWVGGGRDFTKNAIAVVGTAFGASSLYAAGTAAEASAAAADATGSAVSAPSTLSSLGTAATKGALINGGLTTARGGSIDDIINSALIGGATGALGSGVGAINPAGSIGLSGGVGNLANQALTKAIIAQLMGQNAGQAAGGSAINGAINTTLKGGWKDGGHIPPQSDDPDGNQDTVMTELPDGSVRPALSGGEFVVPSDVTALLEKLQPGWLQGLVDKFHVPENQ